jgi:NAD(P)H-dependent flavin oxidoreductase YrpB (nitropropane dioxygenase family)
LSTPIIQGPLGGLSQRLTAAVSDFGGLGSFGAHGLEPNAIEDVIAEIRSLTAKPFAMNLWVSMEDAGARTSDAAAFSRALSHLAPHIEAVKLAVNVSGCAVMAPQVVNTMMERQHLVLLIPITCVCKSRHLLHLRTPGTHAARAETLRPCPTREGCPAREPPRAMLRMNADPDWKRTDLGYCQ